MYINVWSVSFLSAAEGQRPRNYSSCCCSCWIFCFKNSRNLSLPLCIIIIFSIRRPTYLSISTHLPTYDYLPTYVSLPTPTNLYQHTYLPILTHLPTYVYTPTHTNPCQPTIICTYLYQSLSRSCFTNGLTTFFVE